MIRLKLPTCLGLILLTTACDKLLGFDDNSTTVDCIRDSDCDARQVCNAQYRCEEETPSDTSPTAKGGSSGTATSSSHHGGKGAGGSKSTSSLEAQGGTSPVGGSTAIGGAPSTTTTTPSILSLGGTSSTTSSGGQSGATTSLGGSSNLGGTSSAIGGTSSSGGISSTSTAGSGGVGGTSVSSTLGGAAGSGGTSASTTTGCTKDAHQCKSFGEPGFVVKWQTCGADGKWDEGIVCDDYCTLSGCKKAKSCLNLTASEKINGASCCNARPVPGGVTFNRSPNGSCSAESPCPATVSDFLLDTYEVTVNRFRAFVSQYTNTFPTAGMGANPHNSANSGWDASWNALLPADKTALEAQLRNCSASTYWPFHNGTEFAPINCVSWYLAFAFCVWDGGRLPTEAEWDYAATGGEGRNYPWSTAATGNLVNASYAIYMDGVSDWTAPQPELLASAGIAKWGQYHLAGNVQEWVADAYWSEYANLANCIDCANYNWTDLLSRVLRGGHYERTDVPVSRRANGNAAAFSELSGFRCARDD